MPLKRGLVPMKARKSLYSFHKRSLHSAKANTCGFVEKLSVEALKVG